MLKVSRQHPCSRLVAAASLLLFGLSGVTAAAGQANLEAARQEFERALILLRSENFAGAVALLEHSLQLHKSASALYNLGLGYRRLGQYGRSITAFEELVREYRVEALSPENRHIIKDARLFMDEMRRKRGRVELKVTGDITEVTVDGEAKGGHGGTYQVELDPGQHVFVVQTRQGQSFRRLLAVEEGAHASASIDTASEVAATSPVFIGVPRVVSFTVLVDEARSPAYSAAATGLWQRAIRKDANLVTVLQPGSGGSPQGEAAILSTRTADLGAQFDPGQIGGVTRRVQRVQDRPDVLMIYLAGSSGSSTTVQWGEEVLRPAELHKALTIVHDTYRVPIVVLLDGCGASFVDDVVGRIKGEPWGADVVLIAAQPTKARPFAEEWKERKTLWPIGPGQEQVHTRLREVFDDKTSYSYLLTNLGALLLGAGRDRQGDGYGAADLCMDLKEASQRRTAAGISGTFAINCETSNKAADKRFALTTPAVQVDLRDEVPPFFPGGDKAFHEFLTRTTSVLRRECQSTGLPASALQIGRCTGSSCHGDWYCQFDWDEQVGFGVQCRNEGTRSVAGVTESPTLADFERRVASLATRICSGPGNKPGGVKKADSPHLDMGASKGGSVSYAVMLDRSASMGSSGGNGNDPGGWKRRAFFNNIIQPAILAGRLSRLIVVSFASDVRTAFCFDQTSQPSLDEARRCFMAEVGSDGDTDLIGAARKLVPVLKEGEVVWVLTDGEQSRLVPECASFLSRAYGEMEQGRREYSRCVREQLSAVARPLADHRTVYAIFLAGITGNAAALEELTRLRGEAIGGRFIVLNNKESTQDQERRLAELGATALGQGIEALPKARHKCDPEGGKLWCRLVSEVEISAAQSELHIRWEDEHISNQRILLNRQASPSREGGKSRNQQEFLLTEQQPESRGDAGLQLKAQFVSGATVITWLGAAQPLQSNRWRVEVQYERTAEP